MNLSPAKTLIRDIAQRGVSLEVRENRVRYFSKSKMSPELVEQLRLHKTAVIAILSETRSATETKTSKNAGKSWVSVTAQKQPNPAKVHVLRPGHPLSDFDHDSVFGAPPRYIQHKDPNCESTEFWRHRWAGFFCLECWLCINTDMQVETDDRPEPKPEPQQADRRREWTSEEKSLIDWFNQNFDSHPPPRTFSTKLTWPDSSSNSTTDLLTVTLGK